MTTGMEANRQFFQIQAIYSCSSPCLLSIRFLNPCNDSTCNWLDDPQLYMTTRRWYPTLESLEDGSLIIIGGNQWGG